jgi:GDP-L-fucose synthase
LSHEQLAGHTLNDISKKRIYVAGHTGLAGSAIVRALEGSGCTDLILRRHSALELIDGPAVARFFDETSPEVVILCAAKVGGIAANSTYPGDFISQNLSIQSNVVNAALRTGVKDLVFLGSSCIYPRDCPQPIVETSLLTGPLESTNRAYALAKIAGIEMCWSFNRQHGTRYVSLMPTNLFGPGDSYDLESSHVLPALLRKFHEAKTTNSPTVNVWGTGTALREFLFSDDLGSAVLHVLKDSRVGTVFNNEEPPLLNVGFGEDLTIGDLARLIADVVGFEGELVFDASRPDGTPRKLLDSSALRNLGWTPKVALREGIALALEDFKARYA